MENEYITRQEHEEFRRGLEGEEKRQNKRLDLVEEKVSEIGDLVTSIKELATNMQHMAEEQEKQGDRLQTLENRDGEMWRKVVGHLATTLIGIVVGYIFVRIGM